MSYQPIWFDYNKITDELLQICPGTSIQMHVLLYKKDMKGEKKSYHTEYVTEKNYQYGMTIKRGYSSYLTINYFPENAYVMITANDILLIRSKLAMIERWFQNSTFKKLDSGELIIPKEKDPIEIELFAEEKWLTFKPIVIVKEETLRSIHIPGVQMNMYDKAFINLTIDRFYGMKYLFDTVDIFTLASNMLNYIGRPEFGTNMVGTYEKNYNKGFFNK